MKETYMIIDAKEGFDDRTIMPAVHALKNGGLIVFPTETVYGIGVNPNIELSVHRLFRAKKRPQRLPLSLHVGRVEQAYEYVRDFPLAAQALADAFWPGPLTLILWRSQRLNPAVVGGADTVGIRFADQEVTCRIAEMAGVPIAGTSANISGEPSPLTIEDALADLQDAVEVYVDAGKAPRGVESAVVDLTMEPFRLLRPGEITRTAIEEALLAAGVSAKVVEETPAAQGPRPAVGLLRIVLVKGGPAIAVRRALSEAVKEAGRGGTTRVLLTAGLSARADVRERIDEASALVAGSDVTVGEVLIEGVSELTLYETLRQLEEAGVTHVYVPQSGESKDALVMDRLTRKASAVMDD